MLRRITLDNYKTFTQKTTIDFSATNYKFLEETNVGNRRTLKGSLFVGENASGKTNILQAIRFLLKFLFDVNTPVMRDMPSFYTKRNDFAISYEFLVDNTPIIYTIKANSFAVLEEKLMVGDENWVDRNGSQVKYRSADKKVISVDFQQQQLSFLRAFYFDTHFYSDIILSKWFQFLIDSVYINCSTHYVESMDVNRSRLEPIEYIKENGLAKINEVLSQINYRQKINYVQKTHNKHGNYNVESSDKIIVFEKEGTGTEIPISYESTGNKTFLALLPTFIHATSRDCMIIVDEFSSGFHNELEACLLKYFFKRTNNSQIFFVTHSTSILNNSIIRPDQVYSVKFSGLNGSIIHRFSDEMPREAQNLEKMYLNGVFDGVPYYNQSF